MSTATAERHITAKEGCDEWQRLRQLDSLEADLARESLVQRIVRRDDALFEEFGRPYLETHYGDWIAINDKGRVILAPTASAVGSLATQELNPEALQ